MHLTLLKPDGYFVVWVDGQSVQVGATLPELFGRLSRILEEAVRTEEPITGSWETAYEERTYAPPSPEDVECARAELSHFKGVLVDSTIIAEAPK